MTWGAGLLTGPPLGIVAGTGAPGPGGGCRIRPWASRTRVFSVVN